MTEPRAHDHPLLRAQRVCGWILIVLAVGLGVATVPIRPEPAAGPDVKAVAPAEAGWTYSGAALSGCLALLGLGVLLVVKANRANAANAPTALP